MTRQSPELQPWVLDHITPYQKAGLEFSNARQGSFLIWAPGAGKTWGGILWDVAQPGKSIVITRAITKGQWKREYEALTDISPEVLEGETPYAITNTRTVILNWEILPAWVETLTAWAHRGELSVIFDEIHKAKNWRRTEKYVKDDGTTGKRSLDNISASAALLGRRCHRRLGLTATPMGNSRADLWSQLDIVQPGKWPDNWTFVHRYCAAKPGKHGGLDTSGQSNTEELKAKLREAFHVVKYEEMARSLPAKRRQLCYISPGEQSAPAAFARDLAKAARAGTEALFETRLMEACSRKRKWIKEVVQDYPNHKVCVMTGRRQECEDIMEMLSKLETPVFGGHGEMSVEARVEQVRRYKDSVSPAIFVGTTDAFGEAIDGLQCTDVAIAALLPWTQQKVVQQEGRFDRIGRSGPLIILYPIAVGTVDEHIANMVLEKVESVYSVLEDGNDRDIAGTLQGEENEEEILAGLIKKLQGAA